MAWFLTTTCWISIDPRQRSTMLNVPRRHLQTRTTFCKVGVGLSISVQYTDYAAPQQKPDVLRANCNRSCRRQWASKKFIVRSSAVAEISHIQLYCAICSGNVPSESFVIIYFDASRKLRYDFLLEPVAYIASLRRYCDIKAKKRQRDVTHLNPI